MMDRPVNVGTSPGERDTVYARTAEAPTPVAEAEPGSLDAASAAEELTFQFSEKTEALLHKTAEHGADESMKADDVERLESVKQVMKMLAGDATYASLRSRALAIAAAVSSGRLDVADKLLNTTDLPASQRYGVLCMALDGLREHLDPSAVARLHAQGESVYRPAQSGLATAKRSLQPLPKPGADAAASTDFLALRPNVRGMLEGTLSSAGMKRVTSSGDLERLMLRADFHDRVVAGAVVAIVTSLVRSARTVLAQSASLLAASGDEAAAHDPDSIHKLARQTLDLTSTGAARSQLDRFIADLLQNPRRRCRWCARLRPATCPDCAQAASDCGCPARAWRCVCPNPRDAMKLLLRSQAVQWPWAVWASVDSRSALLSLLRAPYRR
jgi:hypothetical protein